MSLLYDYLMHPLEWAFLRQRRERLVGSLEGRILDLGAGTGANFPYFRDPAQVVAVEPDSGMREQALKRLPPGMELLDSSGEQLGLEDETFDHAICTLVLCSVADPSRCLSEVRRVLKPSGQLHFLEHVRGSGLVGRLHDAVTPVWCCLAHGCHLNRSTLDAIRDSAFEIEHQELSLQVFSVPFITGTARVL